jgi:hypothetical protein
VAIKNSFWDIMPCGPLKDNWHLRGACLHLQGPRVSKARHQHEAGSKQSWMYAAWNFLILTHETSLLAPCFVLISCFTYSQTRKTEATCSSKTLVGFQQTTWCAIISQKVELFSKYNMSLRATGAR